MNHMLTYNDLCIILNSIYGFEENYNNTTCFVISGCINQFKKIIKKFISSNKCKILFCIINKNNHWTLLTIIKNNLYQIYYTDSFGNNLHFNYLKILYKYLNNNFVYLYNNRTVQTDNYTCGYFCIYFTIFFDIIINIQKKYNIIYLNNYINNYFLKDNFYLFLNKYKKFLFNKNEFYT